MANCQQCQDCQQERITWSRAKATLAINCLGKHRAIQVRKAAMTDFYEWLENIPQPYTPTSPPLEAPVAHPLVPKDASMNISVDDITLLDIDEEGGMYFDIPQWNTQACVNAPQIDPSLVTMVSAPDQSFVTVPGNLAETSSKILIYLAQVLDVPEIAENPDEESTEEMMFTAEELEALEPINEENFNSPTPSVIDGIGVNMNPRAKEIKNIVDIKRVGSNRQTFYLAKSIKGNYYWLCSPRAGRDLQLSKLIADYRHRSRAGITDRKTRGIKKLRSGHTIRI